MLSFESNLLSSKAQGSMGQNSPSKFSASKLFGFGGESKKEQEASPALEEQNNPGNFSNSFSTQAIKMETKLEVFKKDDQGPTALSYNFDDEPILAGNTWDVSNNDVAVFNDTEEDDDEEEEEDEVEQKETKSSDVIGFHDDF